MSRAFTKEDSWEEPIVPPRAPLPEGVPNYVTPRGLALLHEEQAALEGERARIAGADGGDDASRKALAVLARRLAQLQNRIASAQVVDPALQAHDTVHFGARVTLREPAGGVRTFQIVGVDESDPERGFVSFTAPIARAVLGKRAGDPATRSTPGGDERLVVVAIDYPAGA